jgi:hypothetical protein
MENLNMAKTKKIETLSGLNNLIHLEKNSNARYAKRK